MVMFCFLVAVTVDREGKLFKESKSRLHCYQSEQNGNIYDDDTIN